MTKIEIRKAIEVILDYDLDLFLDSIPGYLETSCQKTIPICMAIFEATDSYEDAIRTCVKIGGDVDTNACIVGGIAEAFYKEPPSLEIQEGIFERLPDHLADIVEEFIRKYIYPDYNRPEIKKSEELEMEDLLDTLF